MTIPNAIMAKACILAVWRQGSLVSGYLVRRVTTLSSSSRDQSRNIGGL